MIGAILGGLGLAGGLAQSIIGGVKSAKAAKTQKKLIQTQRNKNDAWYNKNYYQDYLNRSDSQAAIRRVEDFMKKRNKNAAATATVMGSTPEVVAAQQQNDQKLMADTMGSIVAQGSVYKDRIQARYQQQDNALTGAQIQQAQLDENGGAQLASNGMSMALNAALLGGLSGLNGISLGGGGGSTGENAKPLSSGGKPQLKIDKPTFPNKFGK